jgi:hypothetical protein
MTVFKVFWVISSIVPAGGPQRPFWKALYSNEMRGRPEKIGT